MDLSVDKTYSRKSPQSLLNIVIFIKTIIVIKTELVEPRSTANNKQHNDVLNKKSISLIKFLT